MIQPDDHGRMQLRWGVYLLLIALAAGNMLGRIAAVGSVDTVRQGLHRPFLSGNDRSRWATIRALVDERTYAIDNVIGQPGGWDTIDMVQHPDRDGVWRLYSSKPPLYPTMLAGVYWALQKLTGWTLASHPFEVVRTMLILVNVLPMLIGLAVLAQLVERYGRTDWGRMLVMAAASLGTFLTTFAVVLNNHLPAALSVLFCLYATMRIWYDGQRHWRYFAAAGLFAAFAVVNELPALAFFAMITAGLLWLAPRATLVGYVPAAVVVAAAFFGTNYVAHGSLRPPYAHRGVGAELFPLDAVTVEALDAGQITDSLRQRFEDQNSPLGDEAALLVREPGERWVLVDRRDEQPIAKYALVAREDRIAVHAWDNWYDYRYKRNPREPQWRDSYWLDPQGIDQGEPCRGRYALHVLAGHHGIFSLTPIWILSLAGLAIMAVGPRRDLRALALLIGLLSVVVIAFYLARPQPDRNYGGMTSGFRWVFWLTPLWLAALLPAADWTDRSWRWRIVAAVLLAFSVLSASYPTWNPWSSPWIQRLLDHLQ